MTTSTENRSIELIEKRLINGEFDFQGTYMAVKSLVNGIMSCPESVTERTVNALAGVIESKRFESQKQSFFLYREACEALVHILDVAEKDHHPACMIIPLMEKVLWQSINNRHRAVAEVLGALPLKIQGPSQKSDSSYTEISFQELISELKITDSNKMQWQGRSLLGESFLMKTGVIKFVRKDEDPFKIIIEPWWMNFLKTGLPSYDVKFDIPVPFMKNGRYLLKIKNIPYSISVKDNLHPGYFAIAYTATKQYFNYPNGKTFQKKRIKEQELKKIFMNNAWLLGRLSSLGIVHTALIPLFHNRVQQERRDDGGIYQWERGGRLDQWLESCRYPNFAVSGLRDFEHLKSLETSKKLHHYIGSHLLSLILVLGSCFRNIKPDARGFDSRGNPVDTRYLFDRDLFDEIVNIIINMYYQGFTGRCIENKYFSFPVELINRLIDEMGVDHHMEEILRIDDQNRMDMDEFTKFLLTRGMGMDEIASCEKGRKDIRILTGPHLGGFSERISVPELIDFIFSCAALCVSGRYIMENRLKQYKN